MKKDKLTLVLVIGFFIAFLSMSIYSMVLLSSSDEEVISEGAFRIYDANDELLGSYECEFDNCGYALSSEEEFIEYYYENEEELELGVINGDYAILQDGEDIFLYCVSLGVKMLNFDAIKYYNTINSENYILVKIDGSWGAISLNNLSRTVEIIYDELSLGENFINGVLDGRKLLAKYDMFYFIIDNKNNVLSSEFSDEIIHYNEDVIITYNEGYSVYSYNGVKLISYDLSYFAKSESYYLFVYNDFILVCDDLTEKFIEAIKVDEYEKIEIEDYEDSYKIYVDEEELV